MANTYTSLHYHFTFSTKNRKPWITQDIENRICMPALKGRPKLTSTLRVDTTAKRWSKNDEAA